MQLIWGVLACSNWIRVHSFFNALQSVMPLLVGLILLFFIMDVIGRALPIILLLCGAAFIWYLATNPGAPGGTTLTFNNSPTRKKSTSRRYYPRFRRYKAKTGPKRKGTRTAFEKAMYPKPRKRKW
jgi:hypothetical protein